MSNYCNHCPYDPKLAHGDNACPFTTLYWDFVNTHQEMLSANHRLGMQVKNWFRKSDQDQLLILQKATDIRENIEQY
jgi:deoxyribodipyrimidine photolyase-related protein